MKLTHLELERLTNICNIRNHSNNIELECIFNHTQSIHFTQFANLFKEIKKKALFNDDQNYIKDTWNLIGSTDTLDIQVHRNNNINQSKPFDIRVTVNNKADISKYCRTNSLEGLDIDFLYKKNSDVYMGVNDYYRKNIKQTLIINDLVLLRNSTDGTIKGKIKNIIELTSSKNTYIIVDKRNNEFTTDNLDDITLLNYGLYIEDYDIKFNVKTEVDVKYISEIDEPNYYEREAEKEVDKFNEFINSKDDGKDAYKTFRLKNRYSYRFNNNRLDITVVRSSKKKLNNFGYMSSVPVKTFIESDLISQDKEYEVEFEIDYNKRAGIYYTNTNSTSLRILDMIQEIKLMLNHYPKIISKTESNMVGEVYKSLIRKNHTDIINKKKQIINYLLQQKKIESLEDGTTLPDDETILDISDIDTGYVTKYKKLIKDTGSNLKQLKSKYEKTLSKIKSVDSNTSQYGMKWNSYSQDKMYFIGPRVVSMNIKDIQKDSSHSIINEDYSVTDKADGLGMIMYIFGHDHVTDEQTKNLLKNDDVSQNRDLLNQYIGYIYLIDQNFKIYKTDLQFNDSIKHKYSNSVLNGEYLDSDRLDQPINMYKIYDLYIMNGVDKKGLPLYNTKKKSRMGYVDHILSNSTKSKDVIHMDYSNLLFEGNPITTIHDSILQISKKKFLYSYVKRTKKTKKSKKQDQAIKTTLHTNSEIIWKTYMDEQSIYKYDGLIYTPINDPVGYSNKSCDYDLYTHTTWNKTIKWKPPYENTIDFLVKEVKNESMYKGTTIYSPLINTKRNLRDGNVSYDKYKTFHLYVGKNISEDNNLCKRGLKTKNRYLSCQFIPSILHDAEAYVSNLNINLKNKEIYTKHWDHTTREWKDNLFDTIKDNTIVEFAYSNFDLEDGHYKTDKSFRWIPIRTRHDKTFEYKKGMIEKKRIFNILNYLMNLQVNSYRDSRSKRVINRYIKNVQDVLLDIPNININFKTRDFNNILNTIIRKRDTISTYYSSAEYISKNININYGNNYVTANNVWFSIHNPITSDMICTGEHIPNMDVYELKYYNQNLNIKRSKSVSIQLQRFHNYIKNNMIQTVTTKLHLEDKSKKISLLDLATGKGGDIYKWINNKISNVVGIDKVYDNIYNTFDGACVRHNNHREKNLKSMPYIDFIVADVSKSLKDEDNFIDMFSKNLWFEKYVDKKYDVVSMMFAIHYLFNSNSNIDMLVQNIDTFIQQNGYFMGCCYDGKEVFNLLSDIEYNDSKVGHKDGKIIWKIKKKYNLKSWNDAEESEYYDLPIEVYVQSINMNITEYLVNFKLLIKKLQDVNIRLEESVLFKDIYSTQSRFELSEDEKTVSFLNRQFIFRKVTDGEISEDKIFDIAKDILMNKIEDHKKTTKKFIAELKREMKNQKKQSIIDPDSNSWGQLKTQLEIYIQDQDLETEIPDITEHYDTIWANVVKKLFNDTKWYN